MENIPQDIRTKAEEVAWLVSLHDADHQDRINYIAKALMEERERCAAIVDCDCANYCDLKEAAEKIRA